jgi:hypothetical protein
VPATVAEPTHTSSVGDGRNAEQPVSRQPAAPEPAAPEPVFELADEAGRD